MTQTKTNKNIITYKNNQNIAKHAKKQTKKFDLKKSFRDGGIAGVIATISAHQGIIKTLVPVSTLLSGNSAITMAEKGMELIHNGNALAGNILRLAARGTITSTALLQWCALNPALAATVIGAIIGAGGVLISATTRLIASKKGNVETPHKKRTK